MKKTLLLGFLLAWVALPGGVAPDAVAALNVVVTTSDLGVLVRAVGGADVTVTTLARAGEDPHFVDARPSFLRQLRRADLLVEGGAELESGWLPPLVNNARNAKIRPGASGHFAAATAAGIALCDKPQTLDRSHGDIHAAGNPHFLLDPENGVRVARALAGRLAQLDTANAEAYRRRAEGLCETVARRFPEWRRRLAPLRGRSVVTYHHSFDYFLTAFEIKLEDTIEPKPGVEPSASHIVSLMARMKRGGVRLVIAEPNRPSRVCERVAAETGAVLLRLPLMPGGVEGTEDYIAFIEHWVSALATATPLHQTGAVR
ncbi:MAG: metal ABC transporter substrate-binding protein [Puniceicoccales bacterium]|jgi:ABC-type Zn uptake system ZnuABC Zn-binding protein ZnuA|nr:metal ABC transporter substrate-binding protein [Puniceicoccales bacterium]